MGLLSRLAAALGIDSKTDGEDRDARASVEHEPETRSERAVKEAASAEADAAVSANSMTEEQPATGATEPPEASGSTTETADTGGTADEVSTETSVEREETAAAGTDATASTGSMTDETNETASATEPAEAAGPGSSEAVQPKASEPVDAVKGIGPAYGEALVQEGVETVADLAVADPAELAARADLPEKSVKKWVDRAAARRD